MGGGGRNRKNKKIGKTKELLPSLVNGEGTTTTAWDDPWNKDPMVDFMDRFDESSSQDTFSPYLNHSSEDHLTLNPIQDDVVSNPINTQSEPVTNEGQASTENTAIETPKQLSWEETLALFRQKNQPITEEILIKWTNKAIAEGWNTTIDIPNIHETHTNYQGNLLLVTAYSYTEAEKLVKEYNYKGLWQRVSPLTGKPVGIQHRDDAINIYNQQHYVFSENLLSSLNEIAKNDALKTAVLKSGKIGDEFAQLVKAVQRIIHHTNNPTFVTGILVPQDIELMQDLRKHQHFNKLGISSGNLGVIELINQNKSLYGYYAQLPNSPDRKGEPPFDRLSEIIKLINENPKIKDKQTRTEKNITPELIDTNLLQGFDAHTEKDIENSPIRKLLIDRKYFNLFAFTYYLLKSPYINNLEGRKINNEADFYKSLALYEEQVGIVKNSYSTAYKNYVDSIINRNDALLDKEMERYGAVNGGSMSKGPELGNIKSELGAEIPLVNRIKEQERIRDAYKPMYTNPGAGSYYPPQYFAESKKLEALRTQLSNEIQPLKLKYPVLQSKELNPEKSGYSNLESLILHSNSDPSLVKNLNSYYLKRKEEIALLKEKLADGEKGQARYWALEQALAQFNKEFNPAGYANTTGYIMRHVSDSEKESLNNIWLSMISIGLGVFTIFFPPAAVVTLPLAVAVGVMDVANEYDQYKFEKGASGGTFDENVALSMVDPAIAYTVLAVAGLVLDVVEVGTFLKSAAKSTKLFNTVTKTVSKEALQDLTTRVTAYADELIASKKLKPENKAGFIKKLTDENTLNKNYQNLIKAKGANMSMDDFLKAHGIPESMAVSKGKTLDLADVGNAKKIAELEVEANKLNQEFLDIITFRKKYPVATSAGLHATLPLVPQTIILTYKVGKRAFETLAIGGKLAFNQFELFFRKRLSHLDFDDPYVKALFKRVHNDISAGKTELDIDPELIIKEIEAEVKILNYVSEFKKIDLNLNQPIEFGGDLMKRDGVDVYVLGRLSGNKIGDARRTAGTTQVREKADKLSQGGINTLTNRPIPNDWDYLPLLEQNEKYLKTINFPWIDEAIESGADIRLIHDPRLEINQWGVPPLKYRKEYKKIRTFLYWEYKYLTEVKGYKLLENGLMVK